MDLDQYRASARSWLAANLERRASIKRQTARTETKSRQEIDEQRILQRRIYEAGFAGIDFPTEFGGQGLTPDHARVFREEAAAFVLPDLGGVYSMTLGPIARSMMRHASPDLSKRHVPKMLSADEIWCQFYSEPEAGSDLAGIRTTARRDGDQWVINGSKIWTTGASYADWAMCLARTDWEAPKHRGLTWFALPTNAKGLTITEIVQIDGNRGFCQEFLEDVVVDDDHMFGPLNEGWTVAQTMLVYERGGGAPMVGQIPRGERGLSQDVVDLARQAGRTDDPVARQILARVRVNDYALTQLGRRLSRAIAESSNPNPALAAYGKLAAGTFAPIRARLALEVAGPAALAWKEGEPRADEAATNYLNGRMVAIASGTNEMQRNGIGERILGLPREPSFDSRRPFTEVVRDARSWNGRVG